MRKLQAHSFLELVLAKRQKLGHIPVIQQHRPAIASSNLTLHGIGYEDNQTASDNIDWIEKPYGPIQKVFRLASSSTTVLASGRIDGFLSLKGSTAVMPWNGGQTFSPHGSDDRTAIAVDKQDYMKVSSASQWLMVQRTSTHLRRGRSAYGRNHYAI